MKITSLSGQKTKSFFKIFLIIAFLALPTLGLAASNDQTSVQINLSKRKLFVFEDGKKTKTFRISIGADEHETPLGKMSLTSIVWNPWWYPPKDSAWAKTETAMPPSSRNPMGPVKMPLGGRIFLHGTNSSNRVNPPPTHGCIRMTNNSIKQFAGWLQNHYAKDLDQKAFNKALADGKENLEVSLRQSIPVLILR